MKYQKQKKFYGDFLNQLQWNYFGTFTSSFRLTSKGARRAIERFTDKFSQEYGGCQIFFACEKYKIKEGFHIHCLIKINPTFLPTDYKAKKAISNTWNIILRGNSKTSKSQSVYLKKYNKKLRGAWYVSKLVHQPNADYDFL